jgi:hypothetical protein
MADKDGEALSRARNDARTDVRNLLTQRAIQSFMYLCESCRDPHSGKWIEDFLDAKNHLEFHGTGAGYFERFGSTYDGPLLAMIEHPKDVVIVSAKRRGKGHGGWSKNNPYLEDRYVEFKIDIDPVSLASRILSVREQIANEWVTDLNILMEANDKILESYTRLAKEERRKKDDELVQTPQVAFERTAVNMLGDSISFINTATSPFRRGNFDLLYNLCTQVSIHRILREGKPKEISFAWLRDFYTERITDYFDGNQPYGRADDFIEELLLSSPSVMYTDGGKAGLADPMGLVEEIIEMRREVMDEWKTIMKQVPEDHDVGIRRIILEKQMEAWGSGGTSLGGTEGFQ